MWAYMAAFKTPMGMSPFRLVYEKTSHLPLNELDEIRLDSYDNARIYKERTKKWHDKRIVPREFNDGERVLLFNSRLRQFPGKLHTKWSGPYTVEKAYPDGHVELNVEGGKLMVVNGQRLKHYLVLKHMVPPEGIHDDLLLWKGFKQGTSRECF
ncbi:unnamed protein product [Rhodiola kirilowii]